MAAYYTLGASLPSLRFEEVKALEISSVAFLEELRSQATASGKEQIDLLLLSYDNCRLLEILQGKEGQVKNYPMAIGEEKLRLFVSLWRNREDDYSDPLDGQSELSKSDIPAYMTSFVQLFLKEEQNNTSSPYFYEDILESYYYDYLQKKGNDFVRLWSALDRNIRLVVAAITAKRFNLDLRHLIIGESELIHLLRSGNWSELSSLEEAEVITAVMRISEEESLSLRQRKLDDLKWSFLDTVTFSDSFSLNAMMAYLLRLQILERWCGLDKAQGEEKFRAIVDTLNKEGREGLQEYRASLKGKVKGREH